MNKEIILTIEAANGLLPGCVLATSFARVFMIPVLSKIARGDTKLTIARGDTKLTCQAPRHRRDSERGSQQRSQRYCGDCPGRADGEVHHFRQDGLARQLRIRSQGAPAQIGQCWL